MNHRADIALAFTLVTCGLVMAGCEAEGVGSVGPPSGTTRKDDSFLIPGYDPEAAKALKKKGKAGASKAKALQVDLKNQRH